jgi:hypothetical protein
MAIKRSRRFEILRRDDFTCRYCGRSAPAVALEVDHVTPRSRGGSDHASNLVTACVDCNQGKAARELSDVTLALQDREAVEEFGSENYRDGHGVGVWRAWIVARHIASIGKPIPESFEDATGEDYNDAFDLHHMLRPHDHAQCEVSW